MVALDAGADLVVRPLKEAIASRYAIIFPQIITKMLLADAFANDLREEMRQSDLGMMGSAGA